LFRQLARVLGCRDEEPKAKFPALFGKYDFSALETYAKFSNPAFIHLVYAHNIFDEKGFRDPGIEEFLKAITHYYPQTKIILASRISLKGILKPDFCKIFRIRGIDRDSMIDYFGKPIMLKDGPVGPWQLTEDEAEFVFNCLGGVKDGAHPFAMVMLANVAGEYKDPAQVLKGYGLKKYEENLEGQLFKDLYENVLSPVERHMLRLCALYRDYIPNLHVDPLNRGAGADEIFERLLGRCLLTASSGEEKYYLHTIIAGLTTRRIDTNSKESWDDHETIANAWLAQLKISQHPSLPNIKAANEAFYHLAEGKSYKKFDKLSDKLLRKNKNIVPQLERMSRELSGNRNHKDDRHVLELLIRLEPREPKYHRFLAQTIEKLNGRGDDEALKHYWEAYNLYPTYPHHLADLGKCLQARKKPRDFINLVQSFDKERYRKSMNEHTIAIYTRCLERVGEDEKASLLRMEQIDKGIKDPAFYNDEANYLLRKGEYERALDIIKKAEERGCVNEYIRTIKEKILRKREQARAHEQEPN
jgi:tetratricopeptide (TPR) repeat protein